MRNFAFDPDTFVAIGAGFIALAVALQAIRAWRAGKILRGGVWLALTAAAALASYFFATFTIRLF